MVATVPLILLVLALVLFLVRTKFNPPGWELLALGLAALTAAQLFAVPR